MKLKSFQREDLSHVIILTSLWHCHDGWATSVNIVRNDGKRGDDLDLQCRRQLKDWYHSQPTKREAEQHLRRKVAIAKRIAPGIRVVVERSPEHAAFFNIKP